MCRLEYDIRMGHVFLPEDETIIKWGFGRFKLPFSLKLIVNEVGGLNWLYFYNIDAYFDALSINKMGIDKPNSAVLNQNSHYYYLRDFQNLIYRFECKLAY